MQLVLGLLIFSFFFTSALIVPFINALYQLKFQRQQQTTHDAFGIRTEIFDRFHKHKAGTPVGGGILIIGVITLVFATVSPILRWLGVVVTNIYPIVPEIIILFTALFTFGLIGFYDDFKKFFALGKSKIFGLRLRHKLMFQIASAVVLGGMMYFGLGINFVNVPFVGNIFMGPFFIVYAAFVIVSFANAVNVTDGLDGLATGLLLFCLFGFWVLSASILDTTLSIFTALLIGSLIAFLYFNIFPARIWLGDVGALSMGALLAVMGLLLGKSFALLIIGGIFVAEILSSLLQLLSKHFLHRKLFQVAPLHLLLQYHGWEEPKIVMRAWMTGIILTALGVWLALI